jgi:hypothetical protein
MEGLASPPVVASASSDPPWGQVNLGSGPAIDLRDGTRPLDLDLSILRKAVSKVEIDEALVRYHRLRGHAFEVLNHILREAHGYRFLKLGRVWVSARLHLRLIVFSLHVKVTLCFLALGGVGSVAVVHAASTNRTTARYDIFMANPAFARLHN